MRALVPLALVLCAACQPGLDAVPLVANDAVGSAVGGDAAGRDADVVEGHDADVVEGRDADAVEGRDADAVGVRDADVVEGRDADAVEGRDADAVGVRDADVVEVRDADVVEVRDADVTAPDAAAPDAAAPDAEGPMRVDAEPVMGLDAFIAPSPGDTGVGPDAQFSTADAMVVSPDASPRDAATPVCGACQRVSNNGTCETAVGESCGRFNCSDYVYSGVTVDNGNGTQRLECHAAAGPTEATGVCQDGASGPTCFFFPPAACSEGPVVASCQNSGCAGSGCAPGTPVAGLQPCVAQGTPTFFCHPQCLSTTQYQAYACDGQGACAPGFSASCLSPTQCSLTSPPCN